MDTSRSSTALSERTVLDRLVQSGITQDRAIEHIRGGWVLVDGAKVLDPGAAAEPPATVELRSIHRS
ncbi:hypothetical protein [Pseudonocardia abyssalis]|jgi:hypothetical protein|uniref:RNA-binding S4 domain-containing protein n=1 Tax=Pseudonocardia abyssalis TaxID=2792008 RepID=A0ABS6UNV2_9PSEU|nr:hypothetical protein [Pseudonocardia abyssalis]MBW0117792.1 hypothetical protein [Pseudonocardia abyssalis]MBW0133902.1 hypothetical protein [Pseudonocardia abyssalis]